MTVYVDDMNARFRRMVMVHMIADTLEELHAMADRIGVRRKWFQCARTNPKVSSDHYDICLSKRALAVRYGAREITWRQCGAMAYFQRHGLPMGDPETAEQRMMAAMRADRARRAQDRVG